MNSRQQQNKRRSKDEMFANQTSDVSLIRSTPSLSVGHHLIQQPVTFRFPIHPQTMTSAVQAVPSETVKRDEKLIDREKTCPLLLRVFLSKGRPHQISEYARDRLPPNELQIYTWCDASLDELSGLVKEVNPDARTKGTTFDFRLVHPDHRSPHYRFRDIGSTTSGVKGPDDNKTLASLNFVIGDYLDVHVVLPSSRIGSGPERDHRRPDHRLGDHRSDRFAAGGRFPTGDRDRDVAISRRIGDRDRDRDRERDRDRGYGSYDRRR